MSNAKEVRPFGIRDKVGYMFGDLANDFSFIFASTYVMVFYTKIMGISTAMVGTMFLIARCIDAFTDIGMGRIVDSSKSPPRTDVSVPGSSGCAASWHWHRS